MIIILSLYILMKIMKVRKELDALKIVRDLSNHVGKGYCPSSTYCFIYFSLIMLCLRQLSRTEATSTVV